MDTKHTALPWVAEFDAIYVPHEGAIAHADTERLEHRANAAFIVKAANCHYDLVDALRALTEWGRDHTSPRDANSPHHLLIAAQAALSKAESQS